MHTRVDSAMDVQVLNTIAMEATIMGAAHTQEATAILKLTFKVLLGHHASKVYISAYLLHHCLSLFTIEYNRIFVFTAIVLLL